jgi:hypothetical protein
MFKPVCVVPAGLWGQFGPGYRRVGKLQTSLLAEQSGRSDQSG